MTGKGRHAGPFTGCLRVAAMMTWLVAALCSQGAIAKDAAGDGDLLGLLPKQLKGKVLDARLLTSHEIEDVLEGALGDAVRVAGGDPRAVRVGVASNDDPARRIMVTVISAPGADTMRLLLARVDLLGGLPKRLEASGNAAVSLDVGPSTFLLTVSGDALIEVESIDHEMALQALARLPQTAAVKTGGSAPRLGELALPGLIPHSLSPNGAWLLAYDSYSLLTQFCVVDVATMIVQSCALWPAAEQSPWLDWVTWSADGKFVAIGGGVIHDGDLWIMDVRTGNLRNLARDGYGQLHYDVDAPPPSEMDGLMSVRATAFAPDGRSVAYSADAVIDGAWHSVIMRQALDGRPVETLVDLGRGPLHVHGRMAWSGDGSRLFFAVRDRTHGEPAEIWAFEPDVGRARAVYRHPDHSGWGFAEPIKTTHDGEGVLVELHLFPELPYKMGMLNASTGQLDGLVVQGLELVHVGTMSPDGQRLLVGGRGPSPLVVMELRDVDRVQRVSAPVTIDGYARFSWARDGTALAIYNGGGVLLGLGAH